MSIERKATRVPDALEMLEEELPRVPSKGWAEMIRKVCEVDPMICARCGGRMKVVAFLTEYPAGTFSFHEGKVALDSATSDLTPSEIRKFP